MSTRNERQHHIDRALVSVLRLARGRLIAEDVVIEHTQVRADYVEPTRAEIQDALRHAEREGRALGVSGETGKKYKLTEAGEAWALEVRL